MYGTSPLTLDRAGDGERGPQGNRADGASADARGDLRERAARVLHANWRGTSTVPSDGLYPHQWSWDSAFIAIGLRHLSPLRAQVELETLLRAQWGDGRVPHIVFNPSVPLDAYFPSPDFWRSTTAGRLTGAPGTVQTSGIVQPPVHALAAWLVHRADPGLSRARRFLARLYPRLAAWHDYLLTRRDAGGQGLVSVVHPWEQGMDNSPCWDTPLARVTPAPARSFRRADLAHGACEDRPTDLDYGRYVRLAADYRDAGYADGPGVFASFAVEDPSFNALLIASEHALSRIAGELATGHGTFTPGRGDTRERSTAVVPASGGGQEGGSGGPGGAEGAPGGAFAPAGRAALPAGTPRSEGGAPGPDTAGRHRARAERLTRALADRLWNPATGLFHCRDLHTGRLLPERGVAGLLPLILPTLPRPLADALVRTARGPHFGLGGATRLVPSYDLTGAAFDAQRYWRGPAWFNTNWLLERGLRLHGRRTTAQALRTQLLAAADDSGFAEYVDPFTGHARGARDFGWTAALTLDLLYDTPGAHTTDPWDIADHTHRAAHQRDGTHQTAGHPAPYERRATARPASGQPSDTRDTREQHARASEERTRHERVRAEQLREGIEGGQQ